MGSLVSRSRRPTGAGGLSGRQLTLAAGAVGVLVTGLIMWSPMVGFAYHSPSLHLVLDSVDACVALLAAYLVHGRYVRGRTAQDLLLAQGLVLLAVAGLGLTRLVELLLPPADDAFEFWLPVTVRVLGAVLIAVAAVSRSRASMRTGRHAWWVLAGAVAVAMLLVGSGSAAGLLPDAIDEASFLSAEHPPLLTGHPALILAQGLAVVCFLVAAVTFSSQATRRDDELLRWLGPACALGAFARVNYALFPSLYTDWLYTGDLLRTGFYLLLLVGAAGELRQYWSAHSQAAVREDRRRLARELHDGVIQELAYIRYVSHDIPDDVAVKGHVVAACDRALDEARAALGALGSSDDETLSFMLHRSATEVATRYAVDVEVDLDGSVEADPDQQHALARITREAVSNAVRHGKARSVLVELKSDGPRRHLTIRDDGRGFDVAQTVTAGSGYGLVSMRDRAQGLPGNLDIEAAEGMGSVVRVTW